MRQDKTEIPDPPSRHHLPFDMPFGRLTVLSKVEGLCSSASGGLPSRQSVIRKLKKSLGFLELLIQVPSFIEGGFSKKRP
jgi:hypothetical protein